MIRKWFRRVWYLMNRQRFERELEEEMAVRREMMNERGRFGNSLRLREASHDVWGWRWFDALMQDVRFAVRLLRRAPAITLTACGILSVGIGLNLTFFQIVNVAALLGRSLRGLSRGFRHHYSLQSAHEL